MIDNLDRILLSEGMLTPSAGFLASVMDAVRRAAECTAAIPFPRRRFVVGLAGGLLCTLFSIAILLGQDLADGRILGLPLWIETTKWVRVSWLVWTLMAAAGTLLAVRLSVAFMSE